MRKTVRSVGGGEMMVQDKLKFTAGDVIQKKKHHNTLVYFIAEVAERDGIMKYRYHLYGGELFENHQNSGWHKADYFDALVDNEHLGEKTDYEVGSFHPQGHVKEKEPLMSIGGEKYYTLSLEKMQKLRSEGARAIKDAWLFYETTGRSRAVAVHNVGWETEGLADDMLRMSYTYEDGKWVDHEKNVMEAFNRGLWIPIKVTDSRIDERKVTQI